MTDELLLDDDYEDDVLYKRIKEFKESLKKSIPDMDVNLLLRILKLVNGSSEVFVAINPVHDDHSWVKDNPKYAVKGVKRTDDGRLLLRTTAEKHGMEASDLRDAVKREVKKGLSDRAKLVFLRKDEIVEITDAFSHPMVREHWSGLPFDLILATVTERPPRPDAEQTEE